MAVPGRFQWPPTRKRLAARREAQLCEALGNDAFDTAAARGAATAYEQIADYAFSAIDTCMANFDA